MLNYSPPRQSWSMSGSQQRLSRSEGSGQEEETYLGILVWIGKQFNTVRNGIRRRMTSSTTIASSEAINEEEEVLHPPSAEEGNKHRTDSSSSGESSSSVPRSQPIDIRNGRERDRSAERRVMNQALRPRHWKSFHCY